MHADHDAQADRDFMCAHVEGFPVHTQDDCGNVTFKPDHRAHLTRVGRLLRKTSLDELPQIFNVLKGEMSIVGPRPNVPWEVQSYHWWHTERMNVLPGITGLAQVRGRSTLQFDNLVRFDIQYVRRQLCLLLVSHAVEHVQRFQFAADSIEHVL